MARKRDYRSEYRRRIARELSRSKARRRTKPSKRPTPYGRKITATPKKPKRTRKRLRSDPRIEIAVREMNRGRSLTATARSLHLGPKSIQAFLREQRLAKRKGQRWVTKDNRPRRVPVMTGGRFRVLTVRGYDQARLVGEHHQAVGEFVRTNAIELIKPFKGKTVQTVSGRKYPLETSPNALHRIAAMDSPPFHEIYEITSNT
jgi:hypothetical protein